MSSAAPGEFRMIGRHGGRAPDGRTLALRQGVAVDEDRLVAAAARLAAENAVLAAVTEPRIIGLGAVGLRRVAVVLLQAGPHFGDEHAATRGRGQHGVGVGVLLFQHCRMSAGERIGVAQRLRQLSARIQEYSSVQARRGRIFRSRGGRRGAAKGGLAAASVMALSSATPGAVRKGGRRRPGRGEGGRRGRRRRRRGVRPRRRSPRARRWSGHRAGRRRSRRACGRPT